MNSFQCKYCGGELILSKELIKVGESNLSQNLYYDFPIVICSVCGKKVEGEKEGGGD